MVEEKQTKVHKKKLNAGMSNRQSATPHDLSAKSRRLLGALYMLPSMALYPVVLRMASPDLAIAR